MNIILYSVNKLAIYEKLAIGKCLEMLLRDTVVLAEAAKVNGN